MSIGFGSDEEVKSTLGFISNFDVLELRAKNARQRAGDGQAALKANQEFVTSQDGQAAQAAAIGEYDQTRRRQRLAAARKAAKGQLQSEGKIDTYSANLSGEFEDGTVNLVKANTAHEVLIDERGGEPPGGGEGGRGRRGPGGSGHPHRRSQGRRRGQGARRRADPVRWSGLGQARRRPELRPRFPGIDFVEQVAGVADMGELAARPQLIGDGAGRPSNRPASRFSRTTGRSQPA